MIVDTDIWKIFRHPIGKTVHTEMIREEWAPIWESLTEGTGMLTNLILQGREPKRENYN